MFRRAIIVLVLFIMYEGFYLLPESMTVIPGVFRMSDAFFVLFPLFVFTIPRTVSRYTEESLLVIAFALLLVLSSVMGHFSFGQSYLDGMMNVRRSFFWLSFFMFIPLLRDLEDVEKLVRLMTVLVGLYVAALVLTKFFPKLGLIHYLQNFYSEHGSAQRFGEYRLFFPYGNIPGMFYFIALAGFLYGIKESAWQRTSRLGFMVIAVYAMIASLSRGVIFPWLIATGSALFSGGRRSVRIVTVLVFGLLFTFQVMSMALNGEGSSFVEGTSLGKMVTKSDTLPKEAGRMQQARMYVDRFLGSPLAGAGNFAIGKYSEMNAQGGDKGSSLAYRRFGFFAASDLGYLKILGEYGLLGIGWVIWWYFYFFRRVRQTLAKARALGTIPQVEALCRGMAYFMIFLLISGVTLAHWIHPNTITILPLMLAIMAVVRVRVDELASASGPIPDEVGTLAAGYHGA